VKGLGDEIEALRMIFAVNERAIFEFVVTEGSLREVVNRTQPGHTRWVLDVLGTWLIQSAGEKPLMPGTTLEERRFGKISAKDSRLLREDLDWRCDAFISIERRLPTAATFIERETGYGRCGLLRFGACSAASLRCTTEPRAPASSGGFPCRA
jgi:hypothetical protein